MSDDLSKKLAEAKKAIFGNQQPSSGKTLLLFKGEARVESTDKKVEIRKV